MFTKPLDSEEALPDQGNGWKEKTHWLHSSPFQLQLKQLHFLFIYLFLIEAQLQYCVGFCRTSTWISHWYTYVPSLLNLSQPLTPSHPSRLSQSPGLRSLSHRANPHCLYILHMLVYMFPYYSLHRPILSFLPCPHPHVHKSVLHIHVSIAALQEDSSVPSFFISYIWVNIQYLLFSF